MWIVLNLFSGSVRDRVEPVSPALSAGVPDYGTHREKMTRVHTSCAIKMEPRRFRAPAFLKNYSIPFKEGSRSCAASWSDELGMLIVQL